MDTASYGEKMKINNLTFRKILIWIKKQTNTNDKKFYILSSAVFIVFASLSIVLDYFTAFSGIWMLLRALILIPITISLFLLGYGISYKIHKSQVRKNPDWVSIRERFSPTWRNRISIIIGAALIVIAYASQQKVGYTIVSSVILAIVIGLFAFMRKTTEEKRRQELGIADLRDIQYNELMSEMEKEQQENKAIKKQKKSQKKYERWGYKDKNYVEPDEIEDSDDLEDDEVEETDRADS